MFIRRWFQSEARRCCACTVLGLGLLDCHGGQTGGEVPDPVPDLAGDPCVRSESVLGVDTMSELGFAANDVLAYAVGTRSASLFWNPSTAPVTYGPERGEGRIELELEHRGGEVRLVRWALALDAATPRVTCPADTLEIDARARLRTSGGALAEDFDAMLVASSPASVQLSHAFSPAELTGRFEVQLPEGVSAPTLNVEAHLGMSDFSGSLWSAPRVVDTGERNAGSATSPPSAAIVFATWPSPPNGQ